MNIKKLFTSIICIIIGMHIIEAQTISDLLKENVKLSPIFVNPIGIDNAVEETDFDSLQNELKNKGIAYKSLNLGKFGNVLSIDSPEMNIGGVCVENMMLLVQEDVNGLLYRSTSCENYRDMFEYLNNNLKDFSRLNNQIEENDKSINVFMLSDKYGIAVMALDQSQMVMTMLMDMENLKGFIGMNPELPTLMYSPDDI